MYILASLTETSMLAGTSVLAGELIDDIRHMFGQVESLLLMALGVFAIWFVFKEFMHSRTIAAFITAAFTVALVLFVAYNVDWLRSMLGDEIKSAAPAVVEERVHDVPRLIEATATEAAAADAVVIDPGDLSSSMRGER